MTRLIAALVLGLVMIAPSVAQGQTYVYFTKVQQSDGTYRIFTPGPDGEAVGRIWLAQHADRLLRDGALAEQVVQAVLGLSGAARRQAARDAYATWVTAGGHSVDFSAFTSSTVNEEGVESANRYLYISGAAMGYLHGQIVARDSRIARLVRLAEEFFSCDQIVGNAARNAALDAAIDRFRDDGGLD